MVRGFGFPRMHKEAAERRDFLPPLVKAIADLGVEVVVETGIGSATGYTDDDYRAVSPRVRVASNAEAYAQDVVLVLRAPDPIEYVKLRRGATLVSMLHFPTRPRRVRRFRDLGVHGISLDSIEDDHGSRMVENMRAVAWNGVEAAFTALTQTWPLLGDPRRRAVRATVLGAGRVGKHAAEAATKYGNADRAASFLERGYLGVEVAVLGRNLTARADYMRERLAMTDVLIDASQRCDPGRPLIPNAWVGWLPPHAVICDLVVDPYVLDVTPPTVRSIEGIPQGSLDHYIFMPGDPAFDEQVPPSIPSTHRRAVASCYSWPGVHPRACMDLYGRQLEPLLQTLVRRGGAEGIREDGDFFERALHRANARRWFDVVSIGGYSPGRLAEALQEQHDDPPGLVVG